MFEILQACIIFLLRENTEDINILSEPLRVYVSSLSTLKRGFQIQFMGSTEITGRDLTEHFLSKIKTVKA
jgi:hypothetical protein